MTLSRISLAACLFVALVVAVLASFSVTQAAQDDDAARINPAPKGKIFRDAVAGRVPSHLVAKPQ